MPKTQNEILSKLTTIASEHKDIAILWLYGSRAKGTAHNESDYDIAIAFKNFNLSSEGKYLRPNLFKLDLTEKLNLPEDKISVVDINQAPAYLAFNIIETGQVLFSDGTGRYYKECNRIWSQLSYLEKENQLEQD